ncbi:AraC family transcriptional regulator [Vallitalea longa]|uniref:AraC family transcriptional regulator n=1 Tax=Vallitalea longa TaxID=2936439 RepID=UPI00249212C3|nr:helix-turn-helix domain-containing protein [Vallitalea longa]
MVYNYLKGSLITREIDINKNYLNYYGKVIDEKFNNISKEIFSFLQSNENKTKFKNMDDLNNKKYLISELNKLAYNNNLVDMCMLYGTDKKYILYNEGSMNKDYIFKQYYKFKAIEKDTISDIIEANSNFNYFPTQKVLINNNLKMKKYSDYLMFHTSLSYTNEMEKFIAMINEKKIITSINDGVISDYGTFYIIDESGNILSSTDKNSVTNKIDNRYLEVINENDGFNFNYNNNLVVYSRSEFTDWYYLTVTPYKNILKNIEYIKKLMFYSILFLIILGVIIAFIASRLYYKPIIQILDSFDDKQNKKEYKNEFAQILGNVNYLKVESDNNEENKLILQALKNGIIDNKLKNKFQFSQFIIMQMISDDGNTLCDYIAYIKQKLIDECIIKEIYENEYNCIVILNQDNIKEDKIIDCLWDIKCEYDIKAIVGIGNIVTTIYDIGTSYDQAVNIINYGNSSNETGIYKYNVDNATNNSIYIPLDFKQKLVENIYLGNKKAIEDIIVGIFDKNKNIPNRYMNNLLVEMMNAYIRVSTKFKFECNIEKINSDITKIQSVKERKKYFSDSFKSLIKDSEIQEDKSKYVGDFVIDYIEKHYKEKELSIEIISEAINLSTAYISTLFKKYQGIAFSQYLVEYRIEKSKDLLQSSNQKIKDISEQVGFGTYNNFARTFKKKVGISPNEYRLNIKDSREI